MEVKKQIDIKEYEIYNTTTHQYKLQAEKVEEMVNNKAKLLTHIQKSMKQTVDNASGLFWEDSVRAIYKEITGETLTEM